VSVRPWIVPHTVLSAHALQGYRKAQVLRCKPLFLSLNALKRVKKAPETGLCPRLERPAKSAERAPQNGGFYQVAIAFNAIC